MRPRTEARLLPLALVIALLAIALVSTSPRRVLAAAPTITNVQPTIGPMAGGTAASVGGNGFEAGATVTFGGVAATNVVVVSGSTITLDTPAHAAGAIEVVVTNPGPISGSLTNGFTYLAAPPSITGIAPGNGISTGGTAVTITGTDFVLGATVTFGGTAATVTFVNSTQLNVTTPVHGVGAVDVVVTHPDAQFDTSTNGYTYDSAPTPSVTGVSPSSGSTAGGTSVTITGTNFAAGATVKFDASAATGVTFVSSTTITATTPAHAAGAVSVTVTNADTQGSTRANAYTYVTPPAPTVSTVSPSTGSTAGGTSVTITGTGFVSGATVKFGGTAATSVVVVSDTQITLKTPAHTAAQVDVVVTNTDALFGTKSNGYTFLVPSPVISSISPTSGVSAGGTEVTISGSGFATDATVTFNEKAATGIVVVDESQITAKTPAGAAGAVDVVVTNPGALTDGFTDGFTYLGKKPTITTISPTSGSAAGGTSVTITGTNFVDGVKVSFDGVAATGVTVTSATQITLKTPQHSPGVVRVVVTNVDAQSATRTNGYTYETRPPKVTGVTPVSGPTAGNTLVTITGTDFAPGATVTFDGSAATSVTVVSETEITARTPAHDTSIVAVAVTNVDAKSHSLAGAFTYLSSGSIISGVVLSEGLSLIVYSGGTTDQLVAAVSTGGCFPVARLAFFVTDDGKWVVFIPAAPSQVNAAWNTLYSVAIPAVQPIIVRCL